MSADVSSLVVGILIIGILFVLVRPNSKGPALIQVVGIGLQNLIAASMGGKQQKFPKGV
jgi:xanthosine utilization system XapX-like protein